MSNYDYVIVGAGAAGLLLAHTLGNDSFFSEKSILVIDKSDKTENDRTWCFWEKGSGDFDALLHKAWKDIYFSGRDFELSSSISPYTYKMLRGTDFYQHFVRKVKAYSNITWVQDEVVQLNESKQAVKVTTQRTIFFGKQVFSSWLDMEAVRKHKHYPLLQQHFMGWFLKTDKPVFNPSEATFMDFSVPQKGNTRFMYVLPFSENEALVEYTLFSEELLEQSAYEYEIKAYIKQKLKDSDYEILEREHGSIPMTCYPFHNSNSNRIFHIGIAGGWAKPSTGFTFYNTHKQIGRLVHHLKKNKPLYRLYKKHKFWFYDLLLLDILYKQNYLGSSIFESLFKKRKPQLILKFLEEETSVWEDLKIISACPKWPFIAALWNRIF
ncbi:lycopene cyclase family protein [Flagellimonas myxillae]|uniref:lycopene cyclase family protein n=1 Tax=Flagellimonas myxillae TaxID=2942214 RepID=UPI00201F4249|nr:lycopene cyclase family protein [Muricauda myxillae]MCL6266876.1 lycopene cyclase family protein [Muricauda myxillae]